MYGHRLDASRTGRQSRRRRHVHASPELLGVVLRAQSRVDVVDVALEDVLERRSKVAVESGVDDRIEKTVGEAEPQKDAAEPMRNAAGRMVAERFDESEDKERKPTGAECAHNDAERFGCLALV